MFIWLVALRLPPIRGLPNWQRQEAAHLHNIRQVTADFVRAGEGYFSPDGKQIIFQAEEKGTGNPFYQIFVQDLATGPIPPRQPRRRQNHLLPSSGPTAKRSSSPRRISIPMPSRNTPRNTRSGRKTRRPAGTAATPGTSTRTWTSSRPTRTGRT